MVKNVVFFVVLFRALGAWGQGFTPSTLEVFATAPVNSATEVFIYFESNSIDALTLKWRKGDVVQPEGWLADICDYGLCYVGIPASGVMVPFVAPTQAYLKLVVRPEGIEGSGQYHFRVFNINTPDTFIDVVMHVQSPGFSAVGDIEQSSDLSIFPNPAIGEVHIENRSLEPKHLRITDAYGYQVALVEIPPFATQIQDVSLFSKGTYYIFNERKNFNQNAVAIKTLLIQ